MGAIGAYQHWALEHVRLGNFIFIEVDGLVGANIYWGSYLLTDLVGAVLANSAISIEEK
jgi:hypothetical protein